MKSIDMKFDLSTGSIELIGLDQNTISMILSDKATPTPTVTTITAISLTGLQQFGSQLTEFIQAITRLET